MVETGGTEPHGKDPRVVRRQMTEARGKFRPDPKLEFQRRRKNMAQQTIILGSLNNLKSAVN